MKKHIDTHPIPSSYMYVKNSESEFVLLSIDR